MLALSVRQPWAWLIVHGFKPIENRTWSTKVRGRILIHAGKGMTKQELADATQTVKHILGPDSETIQRFRTAQLDRGGIVGSVELADCVRQSDSPWFVGEYGFVLRDPQTQPFIPCVGQLGFFQVSPEIFDATGGGSSATKVKPGAYDLLSL